MDPESTRAGGEPGSAGPGVVLAFTGAGLV